MANINSSNPGAAAKRKKMNGMKYTYLDYLNGEIGIKESDVNAIAQSGDNGPAVCEAIEAGYITPQFDEYSDAQLFDAVRCLCDGAECDTRSDAIEWLTWIAAWDIAEEE